MKKVFFSVVLTFTVLILFLSQHSLASEYPRLLDTAGLLDEYDANEVLSLLDKVSEKQDMDIVILTADRVSEGMSVEQEATELYEYLGYSEDGVMLYICMDDGYGERSWYILTSGYGITALTDEGIGYIADNFLHHLSDGNYAEGFEEFIEYTDSFIAKAREDVPYDTGDMPYDYYDYYDSYNGDFYTGSGYTERVSDEPFNPLFSLVVSLVIGFVIALIVTGIWKGQLKSVAPQSRATSYIRQGSLSLSNTRDIFLYRNVTRTERPRNNSGSSSGGSSVHRSSGGSRTHRSSSGRSYGGRGGRF